MVIALVISLKDLSLENKLSDALMDLIIKKSSIWLSNAHFRIMFVFKSVLTLESWRVSCHFCFRKQWKDSKFLFPYLFAPGVNSVHSLLGIDCFYLQFSDQLPSQDF